MNHINQINLHLDQKDKSPTDKMIIPIRCFSCGKPVAHKWETFKENVKKGANIKEELDIAGLKRQCCRALFMGHTDTIDIISKYKRG